MKIQGEKQNLKALNHLIHIFTGGISSARTYRKKQEELGLERRGRELESLREEAAEPERQAVGKKGEERNRGSNIQPILLNAF